MANDQTYKTHRRLVPSFHIGVFLALLVYFGWSVYVMTQGSISFGAMGMLLSATLITMAVSLRAQVLRVQDRLIRLEMRLRLREALSGDLASRAAHLPVRQLVALRFASDDELPSLVQEVLDGKVTEPNDIKLKIRQWQADHLRA